MREDARGRLYSACVRAQSIVEPVNAWNSRAIHKYQYKNAFDNIRRRPCYCGQDALCRDLYDEFSSQRKQALEKLAAAKHESLEPKNSLYRYLLAEQAAREAAEHALRAESSIRGIEYLFRQIRKDVRGRKKRSMGYALAGTVIGSSLGVVPLVVISDFVGANVVFGSLCTWTWLLMTTGVGLAIGGSFALSVWEAPYTSFPVEKALENEATESPCLRPPTEGTPGVL